MEIEVRIEFNGVRDEEELNWATTQMSKVHKVGASICNSCILPIYNFIWDKIYPGDNMLDHPNYEKVYGKLAGVAFGIGTLLHGINWSTKRKIVINPLGCLESDYVFVKDL